MLCSRGTTRLSRRAARGPGLAHDVAADLAAVGGTDLERVVLVRSNRVRTIRRSSTRPFPPASSRVAHPELRLRGRAQHVVQRLPGIKMFLAPYQTSAPSTGSPDVIAHDLDALVVRGCRSKPPGNAKALEAQALDVDKSDWPRVTCSPGWALRETLVGWVDVSETLPRVAAGRGAGPPALVLALFAARAAPRRVHWCVAGAAGGRAAARGPGTAAVPRATAGWRRRCGAGRSAPRRGSCPPQHSTPSATPSPSVSSCAAKVRDRRTSYPSESPSRSVVGAVGVVCERRISKRLLRPSPRRVVSGRAQRRRAANSPTAGRARGTGRWAHAARSRRESVDGTFLLGYGSAADGNSNARSASCFGTNFHLLERPSGTRTERLAGSGARAPPVRVPSSRRSEPGTRSSVGWRTISRKQRSVRLSPIGRSVPRSPRARTSAARRSATGSCTSGRRPSGPRSSARRRPSSRAGGVFGARSATAVRGSFSAPCSAGADTCPSPTFPARAPVAMLSRSGSGRLCGRGRRGRS